MPGKNSDHLYVERRDGGDYKVSWGNADRASATGKTQGEVIKRAHKIDPSAPVHVERVRHTSKGHPDQWRKK